MCTRFMEIIDDIIIINLYFLCMSGIPACPVGTYIVIASDGEAACRSCPTNSVSTTLDSPVCACDRGYYRSSLEDSSVPCTSKNNISISIA